VICLAGGSGGGGLWRLGAELHGQSTPEWVLCLRQPPPTPRGAPPPQGHVHLGRAAGLDQPHAADSRWIQGLAAARLCSRLAGTTSLVRNPLHVYAFMRQHSRRCTSGEPGLGTAPLTVTANSFRSMCARRVPAIAADWCASVERAAARPSSRLKLRTRHTHSGCRSFSATGLDLTNAVVSMTKNGDFLDSSRVDDQKTRIDTISFVPQEIEDSETHHVASLPLGVSQTIIHLPPNSC
jgi:hypothetical protein